MQTPLKLHIFYCSNTFHIEDFNRLFRTEEGDEYRTISLPCSGKADFLYLVKAFETGADGVVLITCPRNECRYFQGNLRAPKRADEVNVLLDEIGMTGERVLVLKGNDMESNIHTIYGFRDTIRNITDHKTTDVSRKA